MIPVLLASSAVLSLFAARASTRRAIQRGQELPPAAPFTLPLAVPAPAVATQDAVSVWSRWDETPGFGLPVEPPRPEDEPLSCIQQRAVWVDAQIAAGGDPDNARRLGARYFPCPDDAP